MKAEHIACIAAGLIIGLFVGGICGWDSANDRMERQAIHHGYGIINEKNCFQWVPKLKGSHDGS